MEKVLPKFIVVMIFRNYLLILAVISGSVLSNGCGILELASENLFSMAGLNATGTVISKRANIRSSYAVVAADLLELRRGQIVEVLAEFEDDSKVLWYRVRASDEEQTEGWIEAQHIIKEDSLDKSRLLAEEAKDFQAQAIGQLRASSNLRLTPEQAEDNILLRLDDGTSFEIVDWKYVPKLASDVEETQNEEIKAAEEGKSPDEPEKLDEKYDIWYKVRLGPDASPAPMGWVFGRQVSLQIPSDIVYFQTNDRKFVTWQRLDEPGVPKAKEVPKDSEIQDSRPGSWVILTRTNEVKAIDGVEPDFDGILILGFDRYNEEHWTVYHTLREKLDIWGRLPIRLEGTGDKKQFTVNLRNSETGKMEEKRFVLYKDKDKRLRVTPPADLKKEKGKK